MATDLRTLPPVTQAGPCECGCGQATAIAEQTCARDGYRKGEPKRFIVGHNGREATRYLEEDCGHDTPCWIWQLYKDEWGYGYEGKRPAYRVYYEARFGSVPKGLELDHLCRVPSCVNPDHLEAVTHGENMRRGSTARKTHCVRGHPLAGENLYVTPSGRRQCRTCRKASRRQTYLRSKV